MTTLREALTAPETKPAVVADLATLIDSEISGLGGLTGIAIKTAFAAAKKKNPDIVSRVASGYVGTLGDALQPLWERFQAGGGGDFGAFLVANQAEAEKAIMTAVDAAAPSGGQARAMYDKFKPQAAKIMVGALPRLGALLQKHAG
ncbi:hypothetical protein EDD28_0742 [Salana multivorans]|uniref:Uncharacterized protein n=1 Tax=Salana multivorans TaxID=120377 RepID=A0A3N2D8Q2_9MICO|nr:hypothetical protein [Salana multivorans]ROR96166.1 hypothetical protein EDD28_0742 [Salana multivorans]